MVGEAEWWRWLCVHFGVLKCGCFQWHCLCTSGEYVVEIGCPEANDGAVVVWPLHSGGTSVPLSILNEHHRLCQPHPFDRGDERGVAGYLVPQLCFGVIFVSVRSRQIFN